MRRVTAYNIYYYPKGGGSVTLQLDSKDIVTRSKILVADIAAIASLLLHPNVWYDQDNNVYQVQNDSRFQKIETPQIT